jgi:hypothetical protein
VVSIAMCRALVDAGLRGVAGGPMKLVRFRRANPSANSKKRAR